MEYKFLSTALYRAETEIDVPAGETVEIILDSVESDAKALKFAYQYTLTPSLYLSNYNPKIQIGAEIEYVREDLQNDLIFSVINRNSTENVIELSGQDFNFITLTIYNNSTSSITFSKFEVYQSQEVSPTQIANSFYEDIVVANAIKATTVISEGLITDYLITNAMGRCTLKAKQGDTVDYITVENITMGFYTAVLGSETEQFSITTTTAGIETTHLYWWQSIEGDNAYKLPTTIDPRERFPNISDSDRDAFRLMVYKPAELSKKMSIEFALDENGNMTPSIILGAGIGAEDGVAGKGFIYKNTNGFYNIYCQADGGKVGIVMDENGVHITGFADQHCESILFVNNGVELKFAGEETHKVEYVFNENEVITSLIEDQNYITTFGYEDRTL